MKKEQISVNLLKEKIFSCNQQKNEYKKIVLLTVLSVFTKLAPQKTVKITNNFFQINSIFGYTSIFVQNNHIYQLGFKDRHI